MATQWKRVYVSGKGYRWTDGKGNYKTKNPSFRNPANALVDGASNQAGRAGRAAASTASRSASATTTAAGRTAERERSNSGNGIGYRARKDGEKPAAKPQPKPENRNNTNTDPQSSNFYDGGTKNKPNRLMKTSHPAYARLRQAELDRERERLKGVGNSQAAKPAAKPAARPSGGGRGSSAAPSASRPASTASKVGSSRGGTSKTHTYKGHGSNLHVGRHKTLAEHRAAVEKAKGGGSASKTARKYNTPDEKSKYVAPNGKPYAGPGYGDSPNKKKLKAK